MLEGKEHECTLAGKVHEHTSDVVRDVKAHDG